MTHGNPRKRSVKDDRSHARQLLHDVALINARTVAELGPLPPGGLPVQPKRKPEPWRYTANRTQALETPASADAMEDDMDVNRMALAAAIGVASALSACGSDGTTTQGRREPAAAIAKEAAVGNSAQATIAAGTDRPAPVTATTQTVAKTDPADLGPMIPAAELRRKILKLIESAREPQGMELRNFQRILGVSFVERPDIPGYWELRGGTDQPWGYGFISEERKSKEDFPDIHLLISGKDLPIPSPVILCSY